MNKTELEPLRFPIGRLTIPTAVREDDRQDWKKTISDFPEKITALVGSLNDDQLNWAYRPDGWNIRQLVHHCADSHLNAFIRFKLTLTEATPRIRPYHEALWATTSDVMDANIGDSLAILRGLHSRWATLLDHMSAEDFELEYLHPEYNREYSLNEALATYAWHCRHHLAHIKMAIESEGTYR